MKKIVRLLSSLLPLIILAACGGGGGGGSAPAVNGVGSPLSVTATSPQDGDTGIIATTDIKVTFSAAMNPQTVTASTPTTPGTFTVSYFASVTSLNGFNNMTTVTKNFVVPGTLTPDATNKIFTFTPTSPLTPIDPITGFPLHTPRTFKVTIKSGASGVKDASGNGLAADNISSFTIWAGTQQTGTLFNDVVNGVGADGDGNIYLAGYTNGSLGATNAAGSGQTSDILLTKYDPNGAVVWTLQQGGTVGGSPVGFNDQAFGLAVDKVSPTPQLVVAGYTDGTLPMSAISNPDPSGSTHNYFVMTSDFDGTLSNIRATQAGAGPAGLAVSSVARAVATDINGNIYVTGETFGNLRNPLDVSGFTTNYNAVGGGNSAVFVAKYDSSLNLKWTTLMGTASGDLAFGIAVDANSNVYITGQTAGSFPTFANHGGNDVFVAKFNTSGVRQWITQFGTANDDVATAITVDSLANVYVAGGTYGSLFGANADNTATAGTTSDLFATRINAAGSIIWTRQMGTIFNDMAFGVVTDPVGNVFVTGYTAGSLDGNAGTGGADIFTVKFASDGTKQWTKQLGSPQTDVAKGVATFVAPNPNPPGIQPTTGFLYVAGYTSGNLDTNFNLDATFNSTDYFLVKYNSTTGQKY